MRPPSRMGPHAHSHTHLSGMVSYASPSIPNMSLHAALAAAKEKNYNIGAQFTVTVTACDKSVCDVPFGSRGAQPGTEMKKSFWKVRPPLADRRTVPVVVHAVRPVPLNPILCAALQNYMKHVPTRLTILPEEKAQLEKGNSVTKYSGADKVKCVMSGYKPAA